MKNQKLLFCILLILVFALTLGWAKSSNARELKIRKIEFGYPHPRIPFYHLLAELELPRASIIEVEVTVNGKVLRSTDLYRAEDIGDMNRPPLMHRPPSGYGLAHDATYYKNPQVVGWVPWQPGQSYKIKITVRMKKSAQRTKQDVVFCRVLIV